MPYPAFKQDRAFGAVIFSNANILAFIIVQGQTYIDRMFFGDIDAGVKEYFNWK